MIEPPTNKNPLGKIVPRISNDLDRAIYEYFQKQLKMDIQRIERKENDRKIILKIVFKKPYTNSITVMSDIERILEQQFHPYRLVNNTDRVEKGVLHSSFHISKR